VKGNAIKAVDMWAMGVLTFLMVTGSLPFGLGSDGQKRKRIFDCDYTLPPSLNHSSSLSHFLSRLLRKNAEERMTVTEALEHPWIADADSVASKESFDPLVLRGLQTYNRVSLFRKIIASLLVRAMTDKEKEFIQNLFKRYDADGSGYLEVSEVVQILKEAFGLTDDEAKEEAAQVVTKFDANSDGVIGWEEFAELTFQGSLATDKSRIRQTFRLIDQNSDGVISIEELKGALGIGTEQGIVTEADFYNLIKQIDENQDGVISFDEFQKGISSEDINSPVIENRSPGIAENIRRKKLGLHTRTRSAHT
jgi:calcium-dependent protein kinase